MLFVSTVIHPGGFPGVGWRDQKLKDMEWHFCSQNTYRVRLDDSEQDRFFAASEREKQTDLHTVQSVDSNRDHMLLRRNVSSVLTNVPWVSRAERMKQLRRRRQTTEQTPIKGFLTAAHHPIGRFISRFYQPSELYDQTTRRLNQTRWGKNDFESTKLSQPLDCSWLSKLILPFWFSYSLLSSPVGKISVAFLEGRDFGTFYQCMKCVLRESIMEEKCRWKLFIFKW